MKYDYRHTHTRYTVIKKQTQKSLHILLCRLLKRFQIVVLVLRNRSAATESMH